MLFVNFLCVLFLMVLVYGHTISKSIANEDEIDDLFDSLNDVDSKKQHKGKHDRFFDIYRKDKTNEVTKAIQNAKNITKKTQSKDISTDTIKTKQTEHMKDTNSHIKSKLGGFWRKFKIKGKKKDKDEQSRRVRLNKYRTTPLHIYLPTAYEQKEHDSNNVIKRGKNTNSKRRRKNINQFVLEKRKRDVPDNEGKVKKGKLNKTPKNNEEIITPHQEYYKSTKGHHFKTAAVKTYETPGPNDDLANSLASITTKINHLKFLYGINKYQSNGPILNDKFKADFSIESSSDSFEYASTAQIEALLNNIKEKAIQMVAEQNPAITDIITNSVTETTFEADPLLTLQISSPGYAFSSFVTINTADNVDKRTVDSTEMGINDTSVNSCTESHNIEARSISEDAYTIAHSIEAQLQKELQSVINKVKKKVGSKAYKTQNVQSPNKTTEISKEVNKKANLTTINTTKTTTPLNVFTFNIKSNPILRISREKSCKKHEKKKNPEVYATPPTSTYDDYAMLGVYEQMLAKSHENNVMKMLATTNTIMKKEIQKLSKRNSETLTDLNLKENIRKIYNDDEEMPEESLDYEDSGVGTTTDMVTTPDDIRSQSFEVKDQTQDQTTLEDTSFEGLSNKLGYNDYVNGYKHYLKFQKEQGEQKFSNLVKYQAHKHHSVDDIGKFILNKIPQIPTKRNKRNLFDDADTMDDKEVPMKTDDSWLKKHFYLFIENGPPKKYHTSQRVSLKPVTETNNKVPASNYESAIDRPELENLYIKNDSEPAEDNLDEMSDVKANLPAYKASKRSHMKTIIFEKVKNESEKLKEFNPRNTVSKLFWRKDKEEPKKVKSEHNDKKKTNNVNKKNEIYILVDEGLDRYKRNAKKHENQSFSLFSKTTDTKTRKYGYVDVNLVKPTTTFKVNAKNHKSKIRNFLSKIHFRKHKKTNDKTIKRRCQTRDKRFCPFGGIKNMFRAKTDFKGTTSMPVSDYDVMTSHIISLKPIKYTKPLSLDEMQNMIPNITYDIPYDNVSPSDSDGFQALKQTEPSHLKIHNFKTNSIKDHIKSGPKFSVTQLFSSPNDIANRRTGNIYKLTKRAKDFKLHGKTAMYSSSDTKPNELNNFDNDYAPSEVTLDGIRQENNEMQIKLFSSRKPETSSIIPNIFDYTSTKIGNKDIEPQLNDANPVSIKIRAKEFCIVADSHVRGEKSANKFKNKKDKQLELHRHKAALTDVKTNVKALPDYFNDLLMWHGDILSADDVQNPSWEEILRTMKTVSYTTPSMTHLQRELLNLDYIKKDTNVVNKPKAIHPIAPHMSSITERTISTPDIFNEDSDERNTLLEKAPEELNNFKRNYLRDAEVSAVNGNPSLILVDSTLLNDNGDVDHTTDVANTKKMPKNYLKNIKITPALTPVVVAKTNKQPLQYYTTPLPMSVNDFNRFLKENHLDVESVTSPLIELPQFVDLWSNKESFALNKSKKPKLDSMLSNLMEKTKINNATTTKTTKGSDIKANVVLPDKPIHINTVEPDQIDYLDQLGEDLDEEYNFETDDEKKRRKKRSFFVIKDTSTTNMDTINLHDIINPSKDKMQRKMEITIINLDDVDKDLQNENGMTESDYHTLFKNPGTIERLADTKTSLNMNGDTKTTPVNAFNHNLLLNLHRSIENEHIFKELNRILAKTKSKTASKDLLGPGDLYGGGIINSDKLLDETTPEYDTVKSLQAIKPHRVQISGQSYKYDVFYNDNELKSLKSTGDKKLSTPFPYSITNSANIPEGSPLNIFSDAQREFEVTNRRRENEKPRWNREAKTTLEIESQAIETAESKAKNMNPSDMIVTEEDKAKRKFHLFPLIQEKLNLLAKRYNTTKLGKVGTTKPILKVTNLMKTSTALKTAKVTTINAKAKANDKGVTKNRTEREEAIIYDDDDGLSTEEEYYKHDDKNTKLYHNNNETRESIKATDIKLDKRDITVLPTLNRYTAKDVAALEVIVDMAKNTMSFDETDLQDSSENRFTIPVRHPNKVDGVTNSIQVHIAIPYDYQNNKRSVNPVRIRKVFSAKLSSPVDLEYQVHSFEHVADTTTRIEGLSPGMYLIVSNDSSALKGQFALKPLDNPLDLNPISVREANNITIDDKIATTSVTSLAKVTLSKEFISAINKHLVQLYQNFSNLDASASTHNVKVRRAEKEKNHLVGAIKKFFGHDRVCDCRCKPNKTMCNGCATSDAVISELIFEFDNLAQYMSDHCTEIQTFFWMNPSGGKKLKDAVHKIDNSLKGYYKSVKDKCNGRTCETFVTYIDKRNFAKAINEDKTYIGWPMIKDLNFVADILNNGTKEKICFDKTLKDKGDKLIDAFNSCILNKPVYKRANCEDIKRQKSFKNVYSLDNINVNIICNPESSTEIGSDFFYKHAKNNHVLDYTVDEYKRTKLSGLRKLFERKKKKYNILALPEMTTKMTTSKLYGKREAKLNQIESPLIADTGGMFWNDYIKGTIEPRPIRETKKINDKSNINEKDPQSEMVHKTTDNVINGFIATTTHKTEPQMDNGHVMLRCEDTSTTDQFGVDSLSYNINELLKLFGSYTNEEEIYTEDTPTTPSVISKHRHKIKKAKTKKIPKLHKTTKVNDKKFEETTGNTVVDSDKKITKELYKSSIVTNSLGEKNKVQSTTVKETHTNTPKTESTNVVTTKSAKGTFMNKAIKMETDIGILLAKIQDATLDYIRNIVKDHNISDTTNGIKDRHLRSPLTSENVYSSETITKSNPTIVILNEYDEISNNFNETEDIRNSDPELNKLLLTIIEHETNKLNDEWLKVEAMKLSERYTTADIMGTLELNKVRENRGTSNIARKATSQKDKSHSNDASNIASEGSNLSSEGTKSKEKTKTKPSQKGFLNRLVNKFGYKVTTEKKQNGKPRRHNPKRD